VAIEISLTEIFNVTQTNFNALPLLMVTCFGLGGLLPVAAMLIH
jgi:hypothetical protein